MHLRIHWFDVVILIIALWLLLSPTVLGFEVGQVPDLQAPALNAYAVGTALIIFSVMSAWRIKDLGNEIVNILFGCWLVLSPFALGFSDWFRPSLNAVLVGLAVVVFAVLDIRVATKAY